MTKQEILRQIDAEVADVGLRPGLHYTTNLLAADKVKRFLIKNVISFEMTFYNGNDKYVRIVGWGKGSEHLFTARAETEPLALCLAVLPEDRREYYQQLLRECGE